MHWRSLHPRAPRAAAAALGCLLVLSCGSTEYTPVEGNVASFVPDEASPADGSVTLQPGEASGTVFEVRVSAREIADFFGAAFWIYYDTGAMYLVSYDDSTSFLRDDAADVSVQVNPSSPTGVVKVGISRLQNQEGTVKGVDVTGARDLIVLTFRASKVVTGSAIGFVDERGEVIDSTPLPSNAIAVTWAGGKLNVQ
jgi:hypothetical protein